MKKTFFTFLISSFFLLGCGGEQQTDEKTEETPEPSECECHELILDESYNHFYLNEKRKGYNGICKDYYHGGKLKMEKRFENGKVHGKVTEYWENGKVKEVNEYRENLPVGERIIYTPGGEIMYHATYKNGKQEEVLVNKPRLLKRYGMH